MKYYSILNLLKYYQITMRVNYSLNSQSIKEDKIGLSVLVLVVATYN